MGEKKQQKITVDEEKAIRELFACPGMPVFLLKNKDIDIVCPKDMVGDKYQDKMDAIAINFDTDSDVPKVVLKSLKKWPNIEFAQRISKHETFSLFYTPHRRIAGRMIALFMEIDTVPELLSVGVYCRERLNAFLFVYSLSTALLHRPDTKHIRLPDLTENFPAKFMCKATINKCRETIYLNPDSERPPIELPFETVVSNVSPELKMNYFREDVGVNLHHWHWHLIYPTEGPDEVVNKDRHGELFWYMHNQLLRRYDNDRICVGISPVLPLDVSYYSICDEGYYPKLDTSLGSRYIIGRPDRTKFSDISRDGLTITIQKLRTWLARIRAAISKGSIDLPDDEVHKLTIDCGINDLGNLIEANTMSKNYVYYGDVHNFGHVLLSDMHDPTMTYKEQPAVMGDVATAVRDPIFFRWHKTIDNVIQEYKHALPHYKPEELQCPGFEVKKIEVYKKGKKTDELNTFWEQDDINVSRGLDFASSEPVWVRFKHLNHSEFELKISITNKLKTSKKITVRIWLIPEMDDTQCPIDLSRMGNLAIEMDKFVANIKPGDNNVSRKSTDSNLTLSFERSFSNRYKPPGDVSKMPEEDESFCSCGWPHHLYLPIGSISGTSFLVFVMLTPFDMMDKVDSSDVAQDNSIFCGLKNTKYPDRRPMNFPFDRLFDEDYTKMDHLEKEYKNILTAPITIRHISEVRKGRYLMPTKATPFGVN